MKHRKLFFLMIFLIGCLDSSRLNISDDFINDFSSENNRIAGTLYRKHYDKDLSNLTYKYYLDFLIENVSPSAKGITDIIKNADSCCFIPFKEGFKIALLFKKEKIIVFDDSRTAIRDCVVTYQNVDSIPHLNYFMGKTRP